MENGRDNGATGGKPSTRWIFPAVAALFAVSVLVASQLPNLWALRVQHLQSRPKLVYTGTLPLYLDDASADWSFMRQARDGAFFMSDLYSVDDQPRNYVNLLLWPLGAISGWLSADVVVVYNVAKFVFGALLLALLYALACRLFDRPGERLACFFMFVFAGGWEGPIAFLQRHAGVSWSASSPSWWMPEISTFFSMILFPHLTAGFAAMVAVILLMLPAWRPDGGTVRRRAGFAVAAGAVLFILTLFHPYDTVTALGTLWTAPLLIGLAERRWPKPEALQSLVASAVALPAIGYDLYLVTNNPAIRAWDLQNVMLTPMPQKLFMCFGVNALLALLVIPRFRSLSRPQLVMLSWLLAVLVLIVLPFRFQRRMLGGVQVPLAALACTALAVLVVPLVARVVRGWRAALDPAGLRVLGFALLLAPLNVVTPCYLHQEQWRLVRKARYPSWLSTEEFQALGALDRIAPDGARSISSYQMGNLVPPFAGIGTYIGHPALTVDAKSRGADVVRFFSAGPEDDPWRQELLRRWRIEYVLYTPRERALGSFDPSTRTWLQEVFVAGDDPARRAAIYRVP